MCWGWPLFGWEVILITNQCLWNAFLRVFLWWRSTPVCFWFLELLSEFFSDSLIIIRIFLIVILAYLLNLLPLILVLILNIFSVICYHLLWYHCCHIFMPIFCSIYKSISLSLFLFISCVFCLICENHFIRYIVCYPWSVLNTFSLYAW